VTRDDVSRTSYCYLDRDWKLLHKIFSASAGITVTSRSRYRRPTYSPSFLSIFSAPLGTVCPVLHLQGFSNWILSGRLNKVAQTKCDQDCHLFIFRLGYSSWSLFKYCFQYECPVTVGLSSSGLSIWTWSAGDASNQHNFLFHCGIQPTSVWKVGVPRRRFKLLK
jgi:hypothetical protein